MVRGQRLVATLIALAGLWPQVVGAQTSIFGVDAPPAPQQPPAPGTEGAPAAAETPADPVEAAMANLDLRAKICQLMMVTPEGLTAPSTDDLAYIQEYPPGAIVLRRAGTPDAAKKYADRVRGIEQLNRIPLLIGADLHQLSLRERGMASGFVQLPTPLSIAAAHNSSAASALAKLIAEHMQMMGFNFYVGPLLELAPTLPGAPGSIYHFGNSPEIAAAAGAEIMAVLDRYGILPMPMGFPGGGANRTAGSPGVLTTPPAHLKSQELMPFVQAIASGARLMHVGNVLTPTLTSPPQPASQAIAVMQDLLRNDLGYAGVVVAGPMDGPDLAGRVDPRSAAVSALAAGADMLLWNRADTLVMGGVSTVMNAVQTGLLNEATIDAAVRRVLRLKFDHARARSEMKPPKQTLTNQRKFEEIVRAVERRAITVIQNRDQVLPLREENAMPVMVAGVVGARELRDALERHMKPIPQRTITSAQSLGRIERFEVERITKYVRGIRTAILIYTQDLDADGAIAMVRGLRASGIRVVVVLLGHPKLAAQLADADAIMLAYCDSATYVQTLKAVVEALVGEGAVSVVPYTGDLEARVGEARTFNVLEATRTPAGRLPVAIGSVFPAGLAIACDPRYALRSAEWDFGDGANSKALQATHAYKAPGTYPLTLTVTDNAKETSSHTFNVVVRE